MLRLSLSQILTVLELMELGSSPLFELFCRDPGLFLVTVTCCHFKTTVDFTTEFIP